MYDEQLGAAMNVLRSEDRHPTQEEMELGQKLIGDADEMQSRLQELERQREALLEDLHTARDAWLCLVEETEAIYDDVYTRSNLLPTKSDEECISEETSLYANTDPDVGVSVEPGAAPVETPPTTTSAPPLGSEENPSRGEHFDTSTDINNHPCHEILRKNVSRARARLRIARRPHDAYRKTYDDVLAEFRAAHDYDSEQKLFEAFNKQWLEDWGLLIQAVDRAEDAVAVALDAAMAANATLIDFDDESDPNEPYDVDWFDQMMIKNLDRNTIQKWIDVVIVHAAPDLPPIGLDEAVLEQNAAQEAKLAPSAIENQHINSFLDFAEEDITQAPDRAAREDTVNAGSATRPSVATFEIDEQSPVVPSEESISPDQHQDAETRISQSSTTQPKQNKKRSRNEEDVDSHDGRPHEEREGQEQSSDDQSIQLCHRNAFISQSERAYGRKRRRIDTWAGRVRKGYC
jgi:hypothetical protein